MDMATFVTKAEAQACADAAIENGFKSYNIIKLVDGFLLIAYV